FVLGDGLPHRKVREQNYTETKQPDATAEPRNEGLRHCFKNGWIPTTSESFSVGQFGQRDKAHAARFHAACGSSRGPVPGQPPIACNPARRLLLVPMHRGVSSAFRLSSSIPPRCCLSPEASPLRLRVLWVPPELCGEGLLPMH